MFYIYFREVIMKNKLIAIFEKNKKGYLNLPTIRKILGIKKKLPNYEEKNQELLLALEELTNSGYLSVDEFNHYSKKKQHTKKVSLKDQILLTFTGDSHTLSDLIKTTNIPKEKIMRPLKQLELEGLIYYDDYTNRYHNMPSNFFVVKVECNKYGTLYYNLHNKVYNLYNYEEFGIMPYDTILISKNKDGDKIIKILERTIKNVICEVEEKNTIRIVGNSNIPIKIAKKDIEGLPVGTRILTNLPDDPKTNAKIIKILGHVNDLDTELMAIATNNGFRTNYSESELKQIANLPKSVSEEDKVGRVDLTKENIFTIDGAKTKDMDDAISIKVLENGNYELTVSIAHVSNYIKFASPLWQRAEANTTSVYMIDSVLHMLNFQVSNGICSLNPDVLRLAKSFIMEINPQGQIVKFNIADSIIKSKMKMTYEDVNQIFEKEEVPAGYEPFVEDLLKMQELSQIISLRRTQNGSIDFDSKEIIFEFDEDKNITGITTKKSGPAEKLIENFMILANEAVAEYMLNTGLLFVYRNHEIPFADKVKETINIIQKLENGLDNKSKNCWQKLEKFKNFDDPHVIQKLINSLKTKEEFFILSSLILRSMQRAHFSIENKSHFGLALHAYSQVTSPIRRFLDLLIQYILDNIDMFYDEDFDFNSWKSYLTDCCERASALERCADKAEYEANKLYMVDYVAKRPDQEFDCYVSDITPEYLIIKTPELIEGIVFFNSIDDGDYIYNADSKCLDHRKYKNKILIGSKLKVKLQDYDRENRIIYFYGKSPNALKVEMLKRIRNK